jgi:hypothetical protein
MYIDPNLGIKIQYPVNWEKITSASTVQSFGVQRGVIFRSPPEGTPAFSPNIAIGTLTVPSNITLTQIIKAIANETNNTKDFNLLGAGPYNLAGVPAYMIKYTFTFPFISSLNFMGMQIFALKNDKLYKVIFAAEADKFSDDERIIQKMLNSLQITG